jgi:cell division protein FtsN
MTETQGEKELILGNKQLISLFFVVVALCGVCFAMGYIIGRNSSKPAVAADAPQPQAAAPVQSQDPEPPRETSQASPESSSPSPVAQDTPAQHSDGSAAAPASDPVMTRPGRDVVEPARVSQPDSATVAPVSAPQSGGGAYLQVGAVSRVDAENLVRTLKEEKLPALMVESPKKGLYRVLVGPYRQTADLAEAKSRLKTLGFDNAFVQR